MLYLNLSNAEMFFSDREFTWRSYIAAEALSTTKRVELIDKKKFAKTALDKNVEAFVVYIISLLPMAIYQARKTQIALLISKKVKITAKYSDFSNVFSEEKVLVLPELSKPNQYTINL